MDVTLHLGAHRTGSTTLQQILLRNAPLLAREGAALWTPRRTRDGLMAGLIRPRGGVSAQVEARARRSVGRIRAELTTLAARGTGTLIVSEENMLGGLRPCITGRRLYPDAGWRLARLAPAFGDRIRRVLLAIRSYDSWWPSALAQAVPAGLALPDEAHLDHLVTQPRRWRDVIRDVAGAFPDAALTVWTFENLVARPDDHLALALGRPAGRPLTIHQGWHHRSPDADALRQALHDRGDDAAAARITPGSHRWQPFAPHHRAALRDLYAQDLVWLRDGADGLATYVEIAATGSDLQPKPRERRHDRYAPGLESAR